MDRAVQMELEALEYVKPIEEATEPGDSDIQRFYQNATLFITGGTGFIGKQLLEKLLRSCEIKKAYILIRPKKDVPSEGRLRVMLNDPVFEPVRIKKPDFESRIACVEGDVAKIRLGISDENWQKMAEEVDIIFHSAATVRFDEKIQLATMVNIRGTREVLTFGKACNKLRSFVHISTAYTHATAHRRGRQVLEHFYQSPVPPETMIQLANTIHKDRLDVMTPGLITNWPNTYAFTKAIAEELVQNEAQNLPVCIVRPSIVLQSYREPTPGWIDASCIYGPSGIVIGCALGFIRVIFVNNKAKLSFVPVDYVNNAIIAAGWETGVRKARDTPKIYHITSTNSGVTFRHVSVPMRGDKIRAIVSPMAMWYCYLMETNNRFVFWVLSWLLHYIPAYIVDGFITVLKIKKPKELKSFIETYSKFDKQCSVFEFFLTNEWNFDDTNIKRLRETMSETDRTIYNFDIDAIDWEHNTLMWCIGIRKYIMRDGLKGSAAAVARQKWFKLANFAVLMLYTYIFWKILCLILYIWN